MGSIGNELNPCALGKPCRCILSSSRLQRLRSHTRSPGATIRGTPGTGHPQQVLRAGDRSATHEVLIKSKENKKETMNSPKQPVPTERNRAFLQQPVFRVRFLGVFLRTAVLLSLSHDRVFFPLFS